MVGNAFCGPLTRACAGGIQMDRCAGNSALSMGVSQLIQRSTYEVRFSGTGRLRLGLDAAATPVVPHLRRLISLSPGVQAVQWNEITRSLLILYDPACLSFLQARGLADEILGGCGIHPVGVRKNELLWSVTAGAALVLSFVVRHAAPAWTALNQALEIAGFGMTAYSVMTHRGRLMGGPKSLHLDSILAMLSVFNLGSNRAFAGLFVTWLVNFLEIVGWNPVASRT